MNCFLLMMTGAMTSRSRNDVVHKSPTHNPHSHSNNCPNYNLYTNLHHEPTFEDRTTGFVRIRYCFVEEARALNCEMIDGNGVAAMSPEKLTKSYMMVRLRSRATRCASPFCAHFDHADSRWRVY